MIGLCSYSVLIIIEAVKVSHFVLPSGDEVVGGFILLLAMVFPLVAGWYISMQIWWSLVIVGCFRYIRDKNSMCKRFMN